MFLRFSEVAEILETDFTTIHRWTKRLGVPIREVPRKGKGGHTVKYIPFKVFLNKLVEEGYIPFKRIGNTDRKIKGGKYCNIESTANPRKI